MSFYIKKYPIALIKQTTEQGIFNSQNHLAMRKPFCLLSVLFLFTVNLYSQLKPKHIWPATTEFSIKKFHLNYREKEGDIRNQFFLNDCIEGNCSSGEGVFAITYARDVEFRENGSLQLTVNLYKGSFSDDGKKFKGKMLAYNYTLSGSGAKDHWFYADKFTPVKTENLAEDINKSILDSRYITAEGEAIRTEQQWGDKKRYSYTLHGSGASRDAMLELGAASMQGKYDNGQLLMTKITVRDNYPAKTFTGRMNFKNKPLIGKLEFKDGTWYEGFFYDGKYNGPGKLVEPDGKTVQGFWDNGVLKDSQQVNLPSSLWDYNAGMAESKPLTIAIGDKAYTGNYAGQWKDGKPDGHGLFSNSSNTFFYGRFENGMANGLGYFYSLYKTETWACCQRQSELVLSGLFTNNWLTFGNKRVYEYMWYTSSSDPNYTKGYIPQTSYDFSGTFNKHSLDGCGKSVMRRLSSETELSCTMIGSFKDGGLHGWATVDFPFKKQDDKWKGKYVGYFLYSPASPYAEKGDFLSGFLSNPSEPLKYYARVEKDAEKILIEAGGSSILCDNVLISEADKQKYLKNVRELGLYARKLAENSLKQPPPATLVSTYEKKVQEIKYRNGTTLLKKSNGFGITSVITGYDFNNQKYLVSTPTIKVEYRKSGVYKGSREATETQWLTEQEINNSYDVQSLVYSICNVCNGRGYTNGVVHGGHEGGWEKWTDNVFYNRPSTAYSYEITTGCSACRTVGWK